MMMHLLHMLCCTICSDYHLSMPVPRSSTISTHFDKVIECVVAVYNIDCVNILACMHMRL